MGRVKQRVVVAAIVTLIGTAILAPMASGAPASSSPSSGGDAAPITLRVGTTTDLTTDNPWGVNAGSDYTVATIQYDMLLAFSSQDLSAGPDLATGCAPNDDSTRWTCTLRSGLRWSDGTPLTSRDVAFTYRFAIENNIPQYRAYFPFHPVFSTPDDHTLIWKTTQPTFAPRMPPWVYIVPEHVWKRYDGQGLQAIKAVDNTPSIGSGPFILTDWTPGQGWTMVRNPYFSGPRPAVDRIEFRLYSNQEAMLQDLKNGVIDFADGIRPSLYASVEGLPNVSVQKVISDWWLNLAFNFGGQGPQSHPLPALHDLTVRKAIEMAIDKRAIAEKVYQGTAATGDTIIRPASTYWHLDIPADQEFPYAPKEAAQMLQGAGYVDTNGDGIREDPQTGQPLDLLMPASQDTVGAVEAGQLIVGYLKAIGINVDLRPVNDSKMDDYWGSGNFDAYIWYWGGDPDPNYQLSVFTSSQCGGWSDGCWKDPTYDRLYERQRTLTDFSQRLKVVRAAQRRVYDQVPGVVLAYPGWLEAYRGDRFTGWVPAPGVHGYLMPGYNYDSLVRLRPTSAVDGSAPNLVAGWVWLVALGGIGAVSVLMMRRGRIRELQEA